MQTHSMEVLATETSRAWLTSALIQRYKHVVGGLLEMPQIALDNNPRMTAGSDNKVFDI